MTSDSVAAVCLAGKPWYSQACTPRSPSGAALVDLCESGSTRPCIPCKLSYTSLGVRLASWPFGLFQPPSLHVSPVTLGIVSHVSSATPVLGFD